MHHHELLEELRNLYSSREGLDEKQGEAWVERVSEILNRITPSLAREFDSLTPYLFMGLSTNMVGPTWVRIKSVVRRAIAEAEAKQPVENSNVASVQRKEGGPVPPADDATVFVVHGRNEALRAGFFAFLRALGLNPLEWSEAVRGTGVASPYIGNVLSSAFSRARAVVGLLTPDDEVRLAAALAAPDEEPFETTVQLQARPNVLFEAGLAFGHHPDRTLLVQVGRVKPFSDIAGRHLVRLDNSAAKRTDVADRLESAGCAVNRSGRDWLSAGDFSVDMVVPAESDRDRELTEELSISLGPKVSGGSRRIIISNSGESEAREILVLADDFPIEDHAVWVSNQDYPNRLRPGEQMSILIAPTMGSPMRADLGIEWVDPSGQKHSVERLMEFF